MKPISYSGLSTYTQCPRKYKFSRIDLLPDPAGPAADRGKMIHAELEKAILNPGYIMLGELSYWQAVCSQLSDNACTPEIELAINAFYEPVAFSDPAAYIRGILDVFVRKGDSALIGDWKTGRIRDYSQQIMFYQLMVLVCFPEINRVEGRIFFVDHQREQSYMSFSRNDLPVLKDHFADKIKLIHEDQHFLPTPSPLCNWCAYNKTKGGPCPI